MHRGTWKWLSTVHFFALLLLSSAPSSQLMTRTTHHMLLLYVQVILWMFLLHISLLVPCYISNIGLCRTDGLTDIDRQTQGHSVYAIYAVAWSACLHWSIHLSFTSQCCIRGTEQSIAQAVPLCSEWFRSFMPKIC